jgi:D-lactate dehydrogenase (cytochrome)
MASTAISLDSLVVELTGMLGERVSTADAVRDHHSRGEHYFPASPPDLVVFPSSTEEVGRVVEACARHGVPMIPFGAGTSLEGHVSAVRGGVSIDLTNLNAIQRLSVDDLDVTVQAGVTRRQLTEHLKTTGLTTRVSDAHAR